MKQLVVLSGKGGTGKTSLTAAFADCAASTTSELTPVMVDADVDASNLELLLAPDVIERHEFWAGQIAVIDSLVCQGCGTCYEVCRFDAVSPHANIQGIYEVDPFACEGCAACMYQCPEGAISMQEQFAGEWYRSSSRYGPLFHAALRPAQENSGRLVTLIKQHARLLAMENSHDLVLVDGPPGIGCPAIAAASGADLALIVTEPTLSGLHDLTRTLDMTAHFNLRSLVCINKADLNPQGAAQIQEYCAQHHLINAGMVPYDLEICQSMAQRQPITKYSPKSPAANAIRDIWTTIIDEINGDG